MARKAVSLVLGQRREEKTICNGKITDGALYMALLVSHLSMGTINKPTTKEISQPMRGCFDKGPLLPSHAFRLGHGSIIAKANGNGNVTQIKEE